MWLGFLLLALPVMMLGIHLIWPDLLWLKTVANLSVLSSSTIWLSAVAERIGGARQFSLPVLIIGIVSVAGAILSMRFGWLSTAVIVVLYGSINVVSGFIERHLIRGV